MSVVLSKHLPLLASAPGGIQKLRGLILQLAVMGKLVPQDQNDEPASELLKRIAKERARLEAEGVCKKSKVMPLVEEGNQPFEVPNNWELVRLGSVLEMINGRAFKPGDWRTTGVPIVRIQNLNNPAAPFNYCDAEVLDGRHRLSSGDFLISWSGTPGTSFGAFIWNRGEAALNQHIFRCVQVGDGFSKEFLRLAINSQLNILISKAQGGVGLQHVTKGTLEALALPLPPLPEQHRIVAKVDELMALCDRLEAEQTDADAAHAKLVATLLDTLTQSTDAADLAASWQRLAEHFDTLFTTESSLDALKQTILQLAVMGKLVPQDPNDEPASELLKRIAKERARLEAEGVCKKSKPLPPVGEDEQPFALPGGWHWVRFSSYALEVSTGPFGSMLHQSDYRPGGIPLVNPSHMIGGRIVPESHVAVDESKATELSSYRLRSGDIVMARRGEVGRTALVTEDEDGWLCGTGSFVIRLAKDVSRNYVVMLFRAASVRRYLGDEAVGTTMVNLNHGILNAMPIAVPPLAEQHRIVAKVDELMDLCDRLKANIIESRSRQERLAATLIESALKAA